MQSKYKAHQAAHILYFDGNYSQKEIAQKSEVSGRTIANWIREGCWEQLRSNALLAPMFILNNFIQQLSELQLNIAHRDELHRIPNVYEAELQRKLLRCILDMSKFPTELIKSYAACAAPISDIVEEDAPENEALECPIEEFRPYSFEERAELDGFSRNELISFGRDYIGMLKNARDGGYANDDDPSLDKYKAPALPKGSKQKKNVLQSLDD
jgi:hypothetical protein